MSIIPTTTLKPTINLRRIGHRSMTTSMSCGNLRWAGLPDGSEPGCEYYKNCGMAGRQLRLDSTEESPNLADCGTPDRCGQDQAEAEPQTANPALEVVFAFRMSFQPFEKGDPVGDASVPP